MEKKKPPYAKAYIEITNLCNMHCSFCHGHSRPPRFMERKEFSLLLDSLKGLTDYVYYHLMGEPLLHPLLPEFLSMARAEGFRSIITTNGTLLAARGEEILKAGLHKVNISLHSFEKESEEGLFSYLSEVADFAEKAAAGGTVAVLRLWNEGVDGGKNEKTLAFLRARLSGEWAEGARGLRIRDKLHIERAKRFLWPDLEAEETGARAFCYGLRDQFGILADGTVVPCCMDSEGKIALGNAFLAPLSEILASPRAAAIKKGFSERRAVEALCRHCGYATRF